VELSDFLNTWVKEPERRNIRTVNFKIEGGISATLASNMMIRESNRAKAEGWEQVLLEVHTKNNTFQLTLTGIKY
jgi:hypothetical protein